MLKISQPNGVTRKSQERITVLLSAPSDGPTSNITRSYRDFRASKSCEHQLVILNPPGAPACRSFQAELNLSSISDILGWPGIRSDPNEFCVPSIGSTDGFIAGSPSSIGLR